MVVVLERINLLRAEACVSEHANLTGDMTPIVSASISLEFFNQSSSHFLDSSRHVQQILMPASSKFWVTQDNINNPGSVNWWIGVHWSGDSFNSRCDLYLLCLITADDRDATNSLTIESEVLGEGLRENNSIGVGSKQS